jgi:hypothetical protein
MKRFLFPLLVVAGLAFIGYVFFTFLKEKEVGKDPWTATPAESEIVIECNPIHNTINILDQYPNLQQLPGFNTWQNVAALFAKVEISQKISSNSGLFFIANDPSKIAFSIPVVSQFSINDIQANAQASGEFQGVSIYQLNETYFAVYNGLCLGSNSSSFLESCIIAAKKPSPSKELIQLRDKAARDAALTFYAKINDDSWMNLEIQSTVDNSQRCTGTAISSSKKNRIFAIGSGHERNVPNVIPEEASDWEIWMNADIAEAHNNIYEFLFPEEKKDYWSQAWLSIGDSCACDLNEIWINRLSGTYGTFYMTDDSVTSPVAFYEISDTTDWNTQLSSIAQVAPGGLLTFKYPEMFSRYENNTALTVHNYGVFKNGVLYAAESLSLITKIASTNSFKNPAQLKDQPRTALIWHGNLILTSTLPMGFNSILQALGVKEVHVTDTDSWPIITYLRSVDKTVKPLDTEENTASPNDTIQPSEHSVIPNNHSGNTWSVKNHKDNSTETIRHNGNGELELLGSDNKSLWKVAIDGAIIGDVIQIDAFKNGKLQYLFVAGSKLYLLDRNGKNVGNFPLKLKSKPSTGAYAFDYENNKTYRILIGLENGEVLNLTSEGTNTSGWNYAKGKKITAIQYEKTSQGDRLILTNETGATIKIKRNGNPA